MLKFFAFFLCTTALSCWKLEGFPTIESQDFNLSKPVLQGQEIHGRNFIVFSFVTLNHLLSQCFLKPVAISVLRHADLNRTVGLGAKDDEEEYHKKHQIFLSKKAKGGSGGAANIPHHPRQAKNAAFSLVSPPFFLSTAIMHISLTVILAFPSLLLKLFQAIWWLIQGCNHVVLGSYRVYSRSLNGLASAKFVLLDC